RRWCGKCCWRTCRKNIARKKASRYRPDRQVTAVREAGDGQEKARRCTYRRARLVRNLRRPHGLDDELLCDARRLLQPGPAKAENRRGLVAGGVRRADRRASHRVHRIRRPADVAEAEKTRAHFDRGSYEFAVLGSTGAQTY